MSLTKLALSLNSAEMKLLYSMLGGAGLGGGLSLASKKQKKHLVRNTALGALAGGLGYTGYAAVKGRSLGKKFVKDSVDLLKKETATPADSFAVANRYREALEKTVPTKWWRERMSAKALKDSVEKGWEVL